MDLWTAICPELFIPSAIRRGRLKISRLLLKAHDINWLSMCAAGRLRDVIRIFVAKHWWNILSNQASITSGAATSAGFETIRRFSKHGLESRRVSRLRGFHAHP